MPRCNYNECFLIREASHRCARCRLVFYHGEECQRNDWPEHKIMCKFVSAQPAVHQLSSKWELSHVRVFLMLRLFPSDVNERIAHFVHQRLCVLSVASHTATVSGTPACGLSWVIQGPSVAQRGVGLYDNESIPAFSESFCAIVSGVTLGLMSAWCMGITDIEVHCRRDVVDHMQRETTNPLLARLLSTIKPFLVASGTPNVAFTLAELAAKHPKLGTGLSRNAPPGYFGPITEQDLVGINHAVFDVALCAPPEARTAVPDFESRDFYSHPSHDEDHHSPLHWQAVSATTHTLQRLELINTSLSSTSLPIEQLGPQCHSSEVWHGVSHTPRSTASHQQQNLKTVVECITMWNVSSPEGLIRLRCCQLESHYEGGVWNEDWDAYSDTEFFASWAKVNAAGHDPLGEHYTQLLYLHSEYNCKNHTLTNTEFKAFEDLGAALGLQQAQSRILPKLIMLMGCCMFGVPEHSWDRHLYNIFSDTNITTGHPRDWGCPALPNLRGVPDEFIQSVAQWLT